MLAFNCLLQNTQLYKDIQAFVRKQMYERVRDGASVTVRDVYNSAKAEHLDLDIETVGAIYKEFAPQIRATVGNDVLDTDIQVDKQTGKIINAAVGRIVSNRSKKTTQNVGEQKPSASAATQVLKLFNTNILGKKDEVEKSVMKEMEDNLKKAAIALLKNDGNQKIPATTDEILNKALKVDELSVTDIKGQLNTMDDLFNQFSEEIDNVIKKLEASKMGMPKSKVQEINQKIDLFKNYTENIKQGAYTLVLSENEQKKVLRDLLKPKYGKTITSNGKQTVIVDWNKAFQNSKGFRQDVSEVLKNKGYTDSQINKIIAALEDQFNNLKTSSQWNNVQLAKQKKLLNDEDFLTRAANEVVKSKKDKNGEFYKKYDSSVNSNVPDWDRYKEETGKDIEDLKNDIKDTIQNTKPITADNYLLSLKDKNGNPYYQVVNNVKQPDWNRYANDKKITVNAAKDKIAEIVSSNAFQYRQAVSDLAKMNNPKNVISKSDLKKLSELADRNEFNELFNAKVYSMLGISEQDAESGRRLQELTEKVKKIMDKGGDLPKLAFSKIMDDMNSLMSTVHGDRSTMIRYMRRVEFVMGNRNAFRLLNHLNVVENSLSGISQIVQTYIQAFDKKTAQIELKKMLVVALDVLKGGTHFDITNIERLSYQAHDYKFDADKSMKHNIKAMMSIIPNAMLGVLDSAAHAYTMRVMFYNSAVLHEISYQKTLMASDLKKKGLTQSQIDSTIDKKSEEIKESAITKVSDVLYNPTAEVEALKKAEEILKIATPNPSVTEIKREADNLMFANLVSKGVVNQPQLESLLKAADMSAKKAIGKEAAHDWNWISVGLSNVNRNQRARIKKNIQEGNLRKAGVQIFYNALVMKGIMPYVSGAANWGIITAKKTPLGLYNAVVFNRKAFKEEIAKVANMSPQDLYKTMEKYNSLRNDMYFAYTGMAYTSIILLSLAAYAKAFGDDDDEGTLAWIKDMFQTVAENPEGKKILQRWLPPMLHTINLASGNVPLKGQGVDDVSQFLGLGVLESPLTKAFKYTSPKHALSGLGNSIGGITEMGAYYNWANNWIDLVSEKQTVKNKSYSTWVGDELVGTENDFINGIFSGMMGYNLQQDINAYNDFVPRK
jgi:hypothetical protein